MVCLFPSQLSVDFRRANSGIASDDRHDLREQLIPRLRGPCHARRIRPALARRVHDPISATRTGGDDPGGVAAAGARPCTEHRCGVVSAP